MAQTIQNIINVVYKHFDQKFVDISPKS